MNISKIKILIPKLGLSVFALMFSLLIGECAIRVSAPDYTPPLSYQQSGVLYEPHPVLGWTLIPGAEGRRFGKEFNASTIVNSSGMRDQEYTVAKPPGSQRIAVIGDSFVEGFQVSLDDNFTEVVEMRLNETMDESYEVLNFGVSGYNLTQYYLQLELNVERYDPDLVILVVYLENDIVDTIPGLGFNRYDKPTYLLVDGKLELQLPQLDQPNAATSEQNGIVKWLGDHSALFQFVKQNSLFRQLLTKFGLGGLLNVDANLPNLAPIEVESSPEIDEAMAVTYLVLQQSNDLVRSWDSELLVVLAPNRNWVYDAYWERQLASFPMLRDHDFDRGKPRRLIMDYCEAAHLWCTDLSPALIDGEEKGMKPYFDRYDIHWTENGHRIVADQLFNAVVSNK